MTKAFDISSDFAIVDVKKGRKSLEKHFKREPGIGICAPEKRIPITIKGYLDGTHSGDDGISQEFTMHVDRVELGSSGKK